MAASAGGASPGRREQHRWGVMQRPPVHILLLHWGSPRESKAHSSYTKLTFPHLLDRKCGEDEMGMLREAPFLPQRKQLFGGHLPGAQCGAVPEAAQPG